MLRITHTRGRRAPASFELRTARARIGSAPDCEIALAPDPSVMPRHAELVLENGAWFVVDLGSPAGTYVNRARVARQPLHSGDLVTIGGGAELRVDFPHAPPPGVPDAEGKVDLATAQRMVEQAVVHATSHRARAERIVAEKIEDARRKGARRNSLLTLGVGGALLALLVVFGILFQSRQKAAQLASEAGLDGTVTKPQGAIPTKVMTGREIFDQNKSALYVLGYVSGKSIGGVCSSFAIGPDLLATNAHCVLAIKEKTSAPIVTQNDSGGKVRLRVVGMQMHPGYKAQTDSVDSPDVGLLRVDTRMPYAVTLANDAEQRAIGPGDDVFVIGFPGRVMDPVSPSATFLSGHVGRVTGWNEEAVTPDKAVLVQHDAVTRGGNSGSPVFNQYGHVIAVHAAHIDEEDDEAHDGQKKTVVSSSPFRIGMRIDLLKGVPQP